MSLTSRRRPRRWSSTGTTCSPGCWRSWPTAACGSGARGEFRQYVVANGFRLHREHEGIRRSSPADPTPLFDDGLGFEHDVGELPALVTRPGDGHVYRTRFYRNAGRTMFETTLSAR